MKDAKYYQNVSTLIDTLLKNAAHSFGIDFAVLIETSIETNTRLQMLSNMHGAPTTPLEKEIIDILGYMPQFRGKPITVEDGTYIRRIADLVNQEKAKS